MTTYSETNRSLIIGLDGVSFNILDQLIDKGRVPNIKRLIESGVSSKLKSTYPPLSCTAWSSFITGKNPGKHGIYSWSRRENESYILKQLNSSHIAEPSIWDVLTKNGKKSIIINMPIIYPPEKIDGIMISGMLSPRNDSSIMYPSHMYDEIISHTGEYILDVEWQNYSKSDIDTFLRDLEHCTVKRAEASFYLMNKCEWDLFSIVFVETDRLHHFLMEYIIRGADPGTDPKTFETIQNKIFSYYEKLDSIVGEFEKKVGSNTNIFIVSDHGSDIVKKTFYTNYWLSCEGYLSRNQLGMKLSKAKWIKAILKCFNIDREWIKKKLKFMGSEETGLTGKISGIASAGEIINWNKTRAYSIYADGININLKGREPQGIINPGKEYEMLRDELISRIKEIRDPENGKRIVENVFRKEDIYSGENLEYAPDLIVERSNNAVLMTHGNFEGNVLFKRESKRSGYHIMEGIFIASGPDIDNKQIDGVPEIIDVVPTVLYGLKVPLLEDFDGKALTDIFRNSFKQDHPLKYQTIDRKEERKVSLDSEDEENVIERLKGLGYI